MINTTEIVARQYRAYAYPRPIDDLEAAIRDDNYCDYSDPALIRRKLWPQAIEPRALNILVAGCGTNQAAYYAYQNPECLVVGVDISETSLGHQQYLKEKHGLSNLQLHLMSLEQISTLNQSFDFIVSTGVLHHMSDPDAGLRSLRDVLNLHGVMHIMVYGYWRRVGVYMLQEVFRTLGIAQDAAGIALVKDTLSALPDWHHARSYITRTDDLSYDSGLVDTFLHQQDRAYSVSEVLSFASNNGLKFQSWLDNLSYNPTAVLGTNHPLIDVINSCTLINQWRLVELLGQGLGCHYVLFCHQNKPESAYRLDFSGIDPGALWLDYVPSIRSPFTVVNKANEKMNAPANILRNGHTFTLGTQAASLFAMSNGERTIRDILQSQPWYANNEHDVLILAQKFFQQMANWDHLMFEIPLKK